MIKDLDRRPNRKFRYQRLRTRAVRELRRLRTDAVAVKYRLSDFVLVKDLRGEGQRVGGIRDDAAVQDFAIHRGPAAPAGSLLNIGHADRQEADREEHKEIGQSMHS